MIQNLIVTFSNGESWANTIAHPRALYYANNDNGEITEKNKIEWQKTYDEEFKITMKDEDELIDWARNNMDWKDVKDLAKQLENTKGINKDEEWCNAEFSVE